MKWGPHRRWLLVVVFCTVGAACSSRYLSGGFRSDAWLSDQADYAFEPLVREGASWGAFVCHAVTGEVVMAHNPHRLFIPASNLKLVTTACALERLGSDHTFLTLLVLDGSVRQDTAYADLVIVGGGDPSFGSPEYGEEPLLAWAESVSARGIRVLAGDIVGCGDFLPLGMPGSGWAWDDLGFGFSAPTSGLCYHDNMVDVWITPAEPGNPATWGVEPPAGRNGVACGVITAEPRTTRSLKLLWPPGQRSILLSGVLPVDEPSATIPVACPDPPRLAAASLRSALLGRGITVLGTAVSVCPGSAGGSRIASQLSRPLGELVTAINQESKNVWAEQLVRVMGREGAGDGTTASGIEEVARVLRDLGLPGNGVHMVDGSGLSRLNMASPWFLATLLQRARGCGWGPGFVASLPMAGHSGTLKDRMKGSAAEGRIHAKTGTMQGVRCLSGYATTLAGEPLVFSLLVNGYSGPGAAMDRAIDRFCTLMVMRGTSSR